MVKNMKKRKSRFGKLLNLKLKGTLISMVVIPVTITFIAIVIAISLLAPKVVNSVKEENVKLEMELIEVYLNTLRSEAIHGCDYFSDKQELKQAIIDNNKEAIINAVLSASREIWKKTSQQLPDFITVTDTDGVILAQFQKDEDNKSVNIYKPVTLDETSVDTIEIMDALNGETASAYVSNSLSKMYYNTAKGIVLDSINTIIGTVSLGYRLDHTEYVDDIKGNKEIDVSFFLGDKRVVTTLKDSNNKRRTGTKLDSTVLERFSDGDESYVYEVELFGKKSIGVYIPLYNGNIIAGVVGAAVPVVNINTLYMILIIIGVGIVLSIFFSIRALNMMVLKPIADINHAANTLASGDVSYDFKVVKTNNEVGQLTQSFKKMVDNIKRQADLVEKISTGDLCVDIEPASDKDILGNSLKKMVDANNIVFREIITTAEQVAVAAKQIADGSQELSIGTTQQAAAVEELTSSVIQIAAHAKENEKNVNETNMQIKVITDHSEKGKVNMEQMLTSVEEIEHSSTKISKIIRVIDDIAFQTNILSLNAAVEAARAGEHGRGFAVVAEEVRNLAAKSANAAKETSEMIEESIAKSKQGKEIADKTNETFNIIANGVIKIEKLIAEIDKSSKEQVTSTNAATHGADSVSKVVQTNAATAEESAAASEEMSSQANALTDLVKNQFKLKVTEEDMFCELPVNDKDFGKY